MKRILTTIVLISLFLGVTANATMTRLRTLGEQWDIVVDDANIWNYTGRVLSYPNLGIGEVGHSDFGDWDDGSTITQFGIHWKFGSDRPWVLGTYFYNDNDPFDMDFVGLNQPLPLRLPTPNISGWFNFPGLPTNNGSIQRWSLFYGRPLGGFNFGFNLNMHSASQKADPDTSTTFPSFEFGVRQWDFNFGLTNPAQTWDLALGLTLFSWTNDNTDSTSFTKPDGNMAFSARGRWFNTINPQWTLVPHASFNYFKFGMEDYGGDATLDGTEEISGFNFYGGAGLHYMPTTNVLAVLDAGLSYFTVDEDVTPAGGPGATTSTDVFTLPYFKMGLEADVFNWLDVRLGATNYWQMWTDSDDANDEFKYNFPDNQTYLGFGLNFNRLHVDVNTNPELFTNGFNFLTGSQQDNWNENVMNFHMSVLYEMF